MKASGCRFAALPATAPLGTSGVSVSLSTVLEGESAQLVAESILCSGESGASRKVGSGEELAYPTQVKTYQGNHPKHLSILCSLSVLAAQRSSGM